MRLVLDTSLFFLEYPLKGELFTTPSVVAELLDLRSKCRFETLLSEGLKVHSPTTGHLEQVLEAARRVGDREQLSEADADVLAFALDLNATVLSDDFAVQNVARALAVPVQPVQQRKARKRVWKFRCTGCGRFAKGPGECPVCGLPIKRTIK